jgi:hypothetical protein
MRKRVMAAVGLLVVSAGCDGESSSTMRTSGSPVASCDCPIDWQVENLAVCVAQHTAFTETLLFSSSEGEGGALHCDAARSFPQPVPSQPWSTQRISSPCTGAGTLTLRVRQGKAERAQTSDCVVAEQKFDFDYTSAKTPLALPSVDAWSAQDAACARAYEEEGGYLEFRVESSQLGCGDDGTSLKFVNQCPVGCDLAQNRDLAKCKACAKDQTGLANSL